ncbi:PglZ domain-containing protein [Capnocytophaga sp. ARDL2]|uniref:T9SS response regulator signal transducer PorX n=1 Tax=Capnocytophaga sp. ARDL2 TaxID=3238809 RepID=UPI0035560B6D
MSNQIKILWVDDEIELLKPHILFLEKKKYSVQTASNGMDAIELFKNENFDIVFLDENMPGLSGLETLSEMKEIKSQVPMIMITKSEEEYIMDEAIGSKIADYLIKPVNPNQILLSLKKNLDTSRLVSEKTSLDYQKEFRNISMELNNARTHQEWAEIYKKMVFWEMQLEDTKDANLLEILASQKVEANNLFGRFVEKNYENWINDDDDAPLFSHQLFKECVIPELKKNQKVLFLVIDNLRYDQWKALEQTITEYYKIDQEKMYYSILPTATQYARNAIFSGLTPLEMEKQYPQYWKNDVDEGGKNLFEEEFLLGQISRNRLDITPKYIKITSLKDGKKFAVHFKSHREKKLVALVYNFVDMISHAKTEMDVIKELANDDKAYRSLTKSWFINSPLFDIIKQAHYYDFKLILTTDHGTINCKNPSQVIGDKQTSHNLRYKTGRSLTYEEKDVYVVKDPKKIQLPAINISSSFIFAKNDFFLAYANNFNHYVGLFRNTYQHGGISLEEMIVPIVTLSPRKQVKLSQIPQIYTE